LESIDLQLIPCPFWTELFSPTYKGRYPADPVFTSYQLRNCSWVQSHNGLVCAFWENQMIEFIRSLTNQNKEYTIFSSFCSNCTELIP
jgi:hypothetical protein